MMLWKTKQYAPPDTGTGSGTSAGLSPGTGVQEKPPLTKEERRRNTVCFVAALLSYLIGYLYLDLKTPAFGFVFAGFVEAFAFALKIRRGRESVFWLAMLLGQSAAGTIFGLSDPVLSSLQVAMLHLTAVYYVLCRADVLVRRETSAFAPLDLIAGFVVIPFPNIVARALAIVRFRCAKNALGQWLLGFGLAAAFGAAAWFELTGASDFFYLKSGILSEELSRFFTSIQGTKLLLSIPVGMWLFALISGSLRSERSPFASLPDSVSSLRRIEPAVFVAAMTVLIAIYTLFLVTSSSDFLTSVRDVEHFSAVDASGFAVKGFWNLIRIILLNEVMLALCAVFVRPSSRPKLLTAATFAILILSLAFAALDAVKLGIYIGMFGWTLRRFYAVWAIGYVTLAAVLTMARERRTFPLIRILAQTGIVIFTALCLMNAQSWALFG